MKYVNTLLLTIALLFFSFVAIAQMKWLNPKPSGYNCTNMVFIDQQKGYILNTNGDLLYTGNQGGSWNIRQHFSFGLAMNIDTLSGTGIITSYGTVYITKDRGNSWQQKNTGILTGCTFADVVSSDTIFIGSAGGDIYRSDDAGTTWQAFNCGTNISSMEFINSKVGYAGGNNYLILKTEDGGASWQQNVSVNFIPSNTIAIKFLNINIGYAYREHGSLLSTKDGGKTWANYTLGDDVSSFFFLNENTTFACGRLGIVYRTDDGGISWTMIADKTRIYDYDLNSIWFVNNSTGFATGIRGRILKTTDGGMSWSPYSPTYLDVSDVSFPTKDTGYTSIARTLYKTTDAGNTWLPALTLPGSSSATDLWRKCYFFSKDTGLVIPDYYGRVFKTYDGGANWKLITSTPYTDDAVTDLQFLNGKTGFMARNNFQSGMILKTVDQGETWSKIWGDQYSGPVFSKIFFTDQKNGFGSQLSNLLRTTDSAKTWTQVYTYNNETINSISFLNGKTGFVAGNAGLLIKTSDSGKTWTNMNPPNTYTGDFYAVKFIDENIGFLLTEYGGAFKTIDGGISWAFIVSTRPYYQLLKTITFGVDSTLYLSGGYGAILSGAICELAAPGVSTPVFYCKNEVASPLTAIGDNLSWYSTSTGGVPSTVAPVPTTAIKDTVSYWVTNTSITGCESERKRIDVIVTDASANISTGNGSQTNNVTSITSFSKSCAGLLVNIEPNGLNPVSGPTTAKVWIESAPIGNYVARHYEITPSNYPAIASARITLYFTQSEFDAFNAVNALKLPSHPADVGGIARLLVEKRSGVSNDGTGLPGTYSNTISNINPPDTAVKWNALASRWEVSFDVTGFSGFFVTTTSGALPVQWLNISAALNSQRQAIITWKVQEANVSRYEIEQGDDGVLFNGIGFVSSKGDGVNTYQYTNAVTIPNIAYFRVKKTDKDGKAAWSPVLKLSNKLTNSLSVFPNPANNMLTVVVSDELQHSVARITDINGQEVKTIRLNGQSTIVDVSSLRNGVYFIKFENGKVVKSVKN